MVRKLFGIRIDQRHRLRYGDTQASVACLILGGRMWYGDAFGQR